ncbi:serine hydrolase [Pseudarthrobacter sulfonivorans]|uniref:serine hydrolase n=1 Tax=Pseudarthrobacter sulfonivorans TaxID=121292 RepID=UPI00210719FB|nr:metallo-hydrolase family protein [Pseudarthrobacter sulfonivorans]
MHDPHKLRSRGPSNATRRRSVLAAVAAFLAVALIASVYSLAHAVPSAAGSSQAAGTAHAIARSGAGAGAAGAAVAAPIDAALGNTIDAIVAANSEYQVGVALMDTVSGQLHQYGVAAPFEAASTAKVLTAAAFYSMVEEGSASLEDTLGAFTAGFQIQAMIQDSNNDSWSLLMDAVGLDNLSAYAAALGISYDPQVNTLSTADMAHLLTELYEGRLLDPEHTDQLLSYMQHTNFEDLIPAAVPAGVTVFHKYGLLDDELHDAAILANSAGSYALVVYTKGTGLADVPQRTAVIHDVTAAVTAALF